MNGGVPLESVTKCCWRKTKSMRHSYVCVLFSFQQWQVWNGNWTLNNQYNDITSLTDLRTNSINKNNKITNKCIGMRKERENRETQFYTSHRNIKKRNVHTLLYARDVWTFYQSICTLNLTYFVFVLLFQSIHEQTVQTPIWSIVCVSSNFTWILPQSWAHLFPTENESLLSLRSLYCEYWFSFAVYF